jgi:DNA-binding CsgD family transcriptional regulator
VAAFRELILVLGYIAGAQLDEATVHARRGSALSTERVPLVSGFIDEQLTYIRVLRGHGAGVLAEADAALARTEEGSPLALAALQVVFAFAALTTGDAGSARKWAEPVLTQPVQSWIADSALVLGVVELAERRPAAARERAALVRAAGEQMGHARMAANADLIDGMAALDEGDLEGSRRLLQRSLAVQADRGYRLQITDTLEGLGAVAAAEEDWSVTARLLAAGQAARAQLGIVRTLHDPDRWGALTAAARAAAASAWDEGAALSLEQAVAYARRGRGPRERPSKGWGALTPTETQVASLAAAGRSNPEIASELFMSRTTVKRHLARIFDKLDVANRAGLAAAAGARRRPPGDA